MTILTIAANNIDVNINGASQSGATTTIPPPVINFAASFPNGTDPDGLVVTTGPNPATDFVTIDFNKRVLNASGQITLALDFDDNGDPEISLETFIYFEQTFRPNGSQVIKVALVNINLSIGDPEIFAINGASGYLVITNQGVAAEFNVPVDIALPTDTPLVEFSGTLSFAINTSTQAINEEFDLPGLDTAGIDNDNAGHWYSRAGKPHSSALLNEEWEEIVSALLR